MQNNQCIFLEKNILLVSAFSLINYVLKVFHSKLNYTNMNLCPPMLCTDIYQISMKFSKINATPS